jgi:hypothetical protein
MGGHPARDYWEGPGLALLMGSFLLAPFAWLLEMQVSYSLVKWACAADRRDVLLLLPLGSLSVIGVATAMAWVCWTRLRGQADPEGASLADRSYLLVMAAFAMNALFALLILTSFVPRYYLSPCE